MDTGEESFGAWVCSCLTLGLCKDPMIVAQSATGRTKVMANINSFNTQLAARLATFKA